MESYLELYSPAEIEGIKTFGGGQSNRKMMYSLFVCLFVFYFIFLFLVSSRSSQMVLQGD